MTDSTARRPALRPADLALRIGAGLAFAALVLVLGPFAFSSKDEPETAGSVSLVATTPIETTLGQGSFADTQETWLAMIAGARQRLEFEHFYASERPPAEDGRQERSRLTPVIEAIEAAAERGVRVRFLASERFRETYPETLGRLAERDGIEVRFLDLGERTGGVQHGKMMLADGREAYVGSANFDWRALEHIQELGVHVRSEAVVRAFERIFEIDWALAADPTLALDAIALPEALPLPVHLEAEGGPVRATPLLAPTGLLADEEWFDLPPLLAAMDGAREELRVQLLTYRAVGRDGTYFEPLENALRRAAARGVRVRLMVADWGKRRGTVEGLQSLAAVRNIDVRFVTLPEWSGGFVPFSRCIHAKFLVSDRAAAWIGTSNWEKSYFDASRGMGLLLEGGALPGHVADWFDATWSSPYAYDVDPGARYEVPRIGE